MDALQAYVSSGSDSESENAVEHRSSTSKTRSGSSQFGEAVADVRGNTTGLYVDYSQRENSGGHWLGKGRPNFRESRPELLNREGYHHHQQPMQRDGPRWVHPQVNEFANYHRNPPGGGAVEFDAGAAYGFQSYTPGNHHEQHQVPSRKRSRWDSHEDTANGRQPVEAPSNVKLPPSLNPGNRPPSEFVLQPYIAKRDRQQSDQQTLHHGNVHTSPGDKSFWTENGSNANFDKQNLPTDANRHFHQSAKPRTFLAPPMPVVSALNEGVTDRLPHKWVLSFDEHSAAVNRLSWNVEQHSHLLASASMDKSVRIWDAVVTKRCVQTLQHHQSGIKDVQWSRGGDHLLSCGFDKTARFCHAETGQEVQCFQHPTYVTCVRFHPEQPNVFLSGTYESAILCWDIRTNSVVKEYRGQFGQVLDLLMLGDGSEFISSTDIVSRDSSDRTLIAWDFRTAAVLSNQIYHEKYTCPSLKSHPKENMFIAQTNGDYLAYFSTVRPYQMVKKKRCTGHSVLGYHIGCDISPHGSMIVSGSADGTVHFYDYISARPIHVMKCHQDACTDVAIHPVFSGMVATCSWGGSVSLWQ